MKKLISIFLLLALVTLLAAACDISGINSSSTGNGTPVHMGLIDFTQPTVTINKGDSLNLINDTATVHIIQNGTWKGDVQENLTEAGAPSVNHLFNGNDSFTVGPFNTAGTFHLLCTVHPGMNLIVIVK